MELKVWVDGIQRIVCGVTHATTCQDVVFALAHATSTTGRFTLIERWRSNERLLAPTQHPLKVLLKWGEHASDVQFILQRTALDCQTTTTTSKASPSATQALANLPSPQQEQYQPAYHQHNQHHHQQQLQQQQQQSLNNANNISICHNDGQQQHYRQEQPSYPDNTQQGSPNHVTAQAQRCISPPFGHGGGGSGRDIRKSLTFSGGALGRSAAGGREGGKWPRNRGPNESPSGGHQVGAAGGTDQLQQAPYARVPSVVSSSFPSSTTATSFSPPSSCAEAVNMRLQSQHSREHSRDSTTTTTDGHALSPQHYPSATRHSSQPPWPLHPHTDTRLLHEAHVTNAHYTKSAQHHPSHQSSYDGVNIPSLNNAGNVANFAHHSPQLTDRQQQASTSLNAQSPSKGSPGVPHKLSSPPRVGCHTPFTRPAAPPPYELARGHPPPHLFSNGGSMRGRRQCYSPPTVNPYHIRQNSASNLQTRRVSSREGLQPGPGGAASSLSGQSDPLSSLTNTSPLRLSPARDQHTIGAGGGSAFTRTAPGFPLGLPPRTLPPYRPPPPPPSARLTAPVGPPANYNKLIYNTTDNNYSNNTNNNREQIIYNTKSSIGNSPNKHSGNNASIPCTVSSNSSNYPRLSESPSRRKNISPEKYSRSNSRERLQQLPVNASRNACDQSVRNSSVSHIPMLSSPSGHPPKPLQSPTSAPNIALSPKKVSSLSPTGLRTPNSDFRIANIHSVTQSSNISSSSSIKTLTKFSKSLSAGTLDPQPRLRTNPDTQVNLGPHHPQSSPSSAPSDGFTAPDNISVFGPQDSPSDLSNLTPHSMYTNNNNHNKNNNDSNNRFLLSGEVNISVPSDYPPTTVTDKSIEILNSSITNRFDTKSNCTNLSDARSVSPASTNHQHTTICNGLTYNNVHNNSVVVAAAGNSNTITGDVVESDQCGVGVCSSPTSPKTKPFTAETTAPSTVAQSPRRNQTPQPSECLSSTLESHPSSGPPHFAASGAHASCGSTAPLCRPDHARPLVTSGHEAAGNLSSLPANGHPPLENPSHLSTDASRRQVNGLLLSSSDSNLLMGGDGCPANESRGAAMEEHAQLADALGQPVPRVPQGTAIMGRQVEHVVLDGIHRDLVNLVNLQRDKLTGQQVQLTKFEAEITYVEGRWREDQAKLSYANAEMERLSHLMQQLEREVSEDELRQQELDLSSAVTGEQRLREQLGALQRQVQECDGRVLHLQHSIRSLEEEMVSLRDSQQSLAEAACHAPDSIDDDSDAAELAKQLEAVESALTGKREQVEELKRAMMTENLEALSLTPPDARPLAPLSAAAAANTGGPAGSSRRMLGSPRMLETAVPTSKNPHGVWV